MSKTVCEPRLAERIKVCPNCKHFIFKDDTIDFCASCFNQVDTDIDIVIVENPREQYEQDWFHRFLSWIFTH